jgi:hypothetical protein
VKGVAPASSVVATEPLPPPVEAQPTNAIPASPVMQNILISFFIVLPRFFSPGLTLLLSLQGFKTS